MGSIRYGTYELLDIDDRVLAHVKAAVITKLRRDESFSFSWVRAAERGGGRETVWIHPGIPFVFTFTTSAQEPLNRAWVEALVEGANSVGGMQIVPEPQRHPAPEPGHHPAAETGRHPTHGTAGHHSDGTARHGP